MNRVEPLFGPRGRGPSGISGSLFRKAWRDAVLGVRIGVLLLGLLGATSPAHAYTFTDTNGRQFEGELLAVEAEQVTVRRSVDNVTFQVNRSIFSERDQEYFEQWLAGGTTLGSYRLREGERIRALPRQLRIDLIWAPESDSEYEVQRAEGPDGPWTRLPNPTPGFHVFSDFIGESGRKFYYRVRPMRSRSARQQGRNTPWSEVVSATTRPFNRERLIEEVQEAGVRFFIEQAHPVSGLAPEGDPGWGNVRAIGSSGMGMANVIVGVHRGFISRDEGATLALKMLRFLDETAESHHGAFGHWMDGRSGVTQKFGKNTTAVDLVETSFLIQGVILMREFFDADSAMERELRSIANKLVAAVEWNRFMVNEPGRGLIMKWHWHPENGFGDLSIHGFHEAMMPYILGIGSDTHPIQPSSFYTGWMHPNTGLGQKRRHFGVEHWFNRGIGWPLFFAHYSHIGFDPKALSYEGKTYFEHFTAATKIHQLYARSRADEFKGYDKLWGLAASLSPDGYRANRPGPADNGTIATTAALSSMPYLPEAVKELLQVMYLEYGAELWGAYGFYNAINPSRDWVGQKYIGIELGPIAPMIENYRSGLLWELFMQAPEVKRAQERIAAAR